MKWQFGKFLSAKTASLLIQLKVLLCQHVVHCNLQQHFLLSIESETRIMKPGNICKYISEFKIRILNHIIEIDIDIRQMDQTLRLHFFSFYEMK